MTVQNTPRNFEPSTDTISKPPEILQANSYTSHIAIGRKRLHHTQAHPPSTHALSPATMAEKGIPQEVSQPISGGDVTHLLPCCSIQEPLHSLVVCSNHFQTFCKSPSSYLLRNK